jgi:hypothetical protein
MAWRREPGPESFVLVTVKVAAPATPACNRAMRRRREIVLIAG